MKDKNFVCKHCNQRIVYDYTDTKGYLHDNYLYYCDISRKTHAEPMECKICKAPCLDNQIGQANPLCPKHEEEHRQREKFMTAGAGLDPETAKEE